MTQKKIGLGLSTASVLVVAMSVTALTSAAEDTDALEQPTSSQEEVSNAEWEIQQALAEEQAGAARNAELRAIWEPTWSALRELDQFVEDGYTSADNDTFLFLWDGERTPELEAIVDSAADQGLELIAVEIAHSIEDLYEATRVLHAALTEADVHPDGVGPENDQRGLFVELPSFNASPETIALAERIAADTLPNISVEVRVIDMPEPDGEWHGFLVPLLPPEQ